MKAQWTHWTHSQGGSPGLCNLKGEEANQEETHLWKKPEVWRGFLCFSLCCRVSWQPRAGIVLLGILCVWNPKSFWDSAFGECLEPSWSHSWEQQGASLLSGVPKDGLSSILWAAWHCFGKAAALFVDGFPPALCLHAWTCLVKIWLWLNCVRLSRGSCPLSTRQQGKFILYLSSCDDWAPVSVKTHQMSLAKL